jgi:ribosomal-protein-alanine N-acetyltransferase
MTPEAPVSATPEALATVSARAYRHMRPWSARDFRDMLAAPGTVLIAMHHAFVLGRVTADEAEILALATDPDMQRSGCASAALAAFETESRARGATRVVLEVAAANAPARAFYAARGFSEAGRRKGYYRQPDGARDDALILVKALV